MKLVNSVLPRRNKAAAAKSLAGIAAALIAGWSTASFGAVSVNPNVEYFYGSGPGEGVSVSSDGKFIMVSSPVNVSGETNYSSSVPHLVHNPLAPQPFNLTRDFPLTGYGEVTDVGVMPGGPFGLAVVRSDALHPFNGMLAIRGNDVLQEIPIPAKPDGMKISPDGRYAIVAVEKGGDIRIYDLEGGAGLTGSALVS